MISDGEIAVGARQTQAAMGWPFGSSPPAPPPPTATWANYLFLSHAILELVLGAIKLRGRYAHETPSSRSARSAMYVRHHAFSLLALSLLGYFVWRDDAADTPAGRDASWIFFVFHGGAVAAFTHAWANGAIPLGKVVVPHLPFAVAFLAHALS